MFSALSKWQKNGGTKNPLTFDVKRIHLWLMGRKKEEAAMRSGAICLFVCDGGCGGS